MHAFQRGDHAHLSESRVRGGTIHACQRGDHECLSEGGPCMPVGGGTMNACQRGATPVGGGTMLVAIGGTMRTIRGDEGGTRRIMLSLPVTRHTRPESLGTRLAIPSQELTVSLSLRQHKRQPDPLLGRKSFA